MAVYQDRPAAQRVLSFGAVAALHVALIALLMSQTGTLEVSLPQVLRGVHILAPRNSPPPPPTLPLPKLQAPDLAPMPAPEIVMNAMPSHAAPRAVTRMAPKAAPASHFGLATDDAGLGVDAATTAGGGARGRGNLADFEAAVRRAVLARRVQPSLAWDRRRTCVIHYTVSVARDGSLAGVLIDPCAVAEINQAAEAAIRAAAPFPPPPDLGGGRTDVHGTLVFRP